MNRRAIAAIVRKDLTVVVQSKAVMIPIVIVPLFMFILLPVLVGLGGPALAALPGAPRSFSPTCPPGSRLGWQASMRLESSWCWCLSTSLHRCT